MINELEDVTYKDGELRNSIVSEHVTELCEKNFSVLHAMALNSLIKQYVADPSSVSRLRITELLHQANDIFNDRNLMALTGADAMQLIRTDGEKLVDVSNREHFHRAMRGQDFVSDIIVSKSTGQLIVVIEVPIFDSKGNAIGMLQRNWNLIELQYFLGMVDDEHHSVVVTDQEGRIIADSDKIFKDMTEYIDDDSYQYITEKIREDARPSGIVRVMMNGEDSLVSYSRNYITGWIVFVVKPYHYILEQVYIKIGEAILLGIFMLIIVSAAAHRLAYQATKPIIDITKAADKIAHNSNFVDKIEVHSDDELAQMAAAFNKIRTLRDTYQFESEVDKLTKLYNKTTTENICRLKLKEFDKLDEPKTLTAFFIIDLDFFKRANDTFGHQFGDKVLIEFSKKIRSMFRPNDCIGRFGGDEFIVIIDNLPSIEIVIRKAEGIKKIARELTIEGIHAGISASIGISIVPLQGTTYENLFKAADEALYRVKAGGRDNYLINYKVEPKEIV